MLSSLAPASGTKHDMHIYIIIIIIYIIIIMTIIMKLYI